MLFLGNETTYLALFQKYLRFLKNCTSLTWKLVDDFFSSLGGKEIK